MLFPVSGVETPIWLPPLVALIISFFTSMGGVSGAFLLLPFQVSVLGFTSPAVSATNHVFNITAIPSGVYRYIREKRMVWPLTVAVIMGTLPGVVLGVWLRIVLLPDPRHFKLFAGLVLLYIGLSLVRDTLKKKETAALPAGAAVTHCHFSMQKAGFRFAGKDYAFSTLAVFALCFLVGIVGGIYGIGGGSIVAPLFVVLFKIPVYTVAGAALMGTFVTSLTGVVLFQILAPLAPEMNVAPDWLLGLAFGVGGFVGMYLGARCQKFVPAIFIKGVLCATILFVAGKYIVGFFL